MENEEVINYLLSKIIIENQIISLFLGGNNYQFSLENAQKTQQEICEVLYKHCYTKGNNLKNWDLTSKKYIVDNDEIFINELKQNNYSTELVDVTWKLDYDSKHFIEATKNRTTKKISKNSILKIDHNSKVLHVFQEKESYKTGDPFYFIFGSNNEFTSEMLCRFYFSLKKENASKLISILSKKLNHYSIPFQMKCLAIPTLYEQRCDNAVLYVNKPFVNIVYLIFEDIKNELESILEEDIPLFTKSLFKGISFAESPENGQSFGIDRSRLLAYSILKNLNQLNAENCTKTIQNIGFDIKKLHLNIQSDYEYLFKS